MNNLINKYGIFSLFLWFGFGIIGGQIIQDSWNVFLLDLLLALSYFLILKNAGKKNPRFYNERNLRKIVFWYSLIMVAVLNLLYFTHNGTFFTYNAADELTYDGLARTMAAMPFYQGIISTVKKVGTEDFGAVFYIGTIYRFIDSDLAVNFVNIICGLVSATVLFRIGQIVMPARYAFMASLSYFTASFILYFESSGSKESVFLMLVLMTFYNFYNYILKRKMQNLYIAVFFGAAILLYRPAVLGMTIVSLGIGTLLFYSSGVRNVIISVVLAIAFVYLSATFDHLFSTFSSFHQSILYRSDAIGQVDKTIAISAAFIASTIGPLPSLLPKLGKEMSTLYAAGLMMRVLLAAPFLLGALYIIKHKRQLLYGFLAMVFIEAGSLFYIMESYELRFHLFHLPFVFLIGFYYLSQLDFANPKVVIGRKRILLGLSLFFMFLVFYWNLRYV